MIFWFVLTFSLTYMLVDPFFSGDNTEGSENFSVTLSDVQTVNFTSDSQDLNASSTSATSFISPIKFFDMFVRIFTFRIPSTNFPVLLSLIISFLNWFLILMLGTQIYRQARSGGG